jgi:hypothetical protein
MSRRSCTDSYAASLSGIFYLIQDVPRNSRLASQPSETEIADATADVIAYLEANMPIIILRSGTHSISAHPSCSDNGVLLVPSHRKVI